MSERMPLRQFEIAHECDEAGQYATVRRRSDGKVFVRISSEELPRDELLAVIELQRRLAVILEGERLREAMASATPDGDASGEIRGHGG